MPLIQIAPFSTCCSQKEPFKRHCSLYSTEKPDTVRYADTVRYKTYLRGCLNTHPGERGFLCLLRRGGKSLSLEWRRPSHFSLGWVAISWLCLGFLVSWELQSKAYRKKKQFFFQRLPYFCSGPIIHLLFILQLVEGRHKFSMFVLKRFCKILSISGFFNSEETYSFLSVLHKIYSCSCQCVAIKIETGQGDDALCRFEVTAIKMPWLREDLDEHLDGGIRYKSKSASEVRFKQAKK